MMHEIWGLCHIKKGINFQDIFFFFTEMILLAYVPTMFHGFKGSSPWPPRFVEVWSQWDNTRGKDQSTPSEGAFLLMGVAGNQVTFEERYLLGNELVAVGYQLQEIYSMMLWMKRCFILYFSFIIYYIVFFYMCHIISPTVTYRGLRRIRTYNQNVYASGPLGIWGGNSMKGRSGIAPHMPEVNSDGDQWRFWKVNSLFK